MKKETAPVTTVDEYIASYPAAVKKLLKEVRKTIKAAAPDAEEVLSYHMPAYKYHGMLVYFAAHTNHIGLYPFRTAIAAFKKELSVYEGAAGTVRFYLDQPLPLTLISKIIKFRVKENLEKARVKKEMKVLLKSKNKLK
jgi:uncharacterized protein YdhG (YjbR/CyaY superfamily)